MASPLRLTFCGASAGAVAGGVGPIDAWAAVQDRVRAAEAELSRFRPTSDLTRLNLAAGSGRPVDVPRRLERALVAADRAHRVTGGRFDSTRASRPGAARLSGRSARAGAHGRRSIDRVVQRVRPRRTGWPSAPIDLGGIGKGLTLRWAAALVDAARRRRRTS